MQPKTWLLRMAIRLLKGTFFAISGLGITLLMAAIIGAMPLLESILDVVGSSLIRILGFIGCFAAAAVIGESLNQ